MAVVERREPELARARHLLARMDDVVDLAILLLPAFEHERRRGHVRIEAVRVRLRHVDRGLAPNHPLGHVLAEPAGVRDPHGLADPPRTADDSPTIEPASGVNENIPLIERSGSVGRIRPFRAGSRRAASASATSKSPGVKGISDGMGPGRHAAAHAEA